VKCSIALRRLGYRVAFRLLQVRWVLLRPEQTGVKCLITDGERVLLVRHTYGPRAWDLPGGRTGRGEPALAAARREMEEELGLGAAPWRELGALRGRSYGRHDCIDVVAALVAPDIELTVDPVEIEAAAWFERDRLPLWVSRFVTPILTGTAPHLFDDGDARPPTAGR
jgi:8-oxo-dGTP pyrophosphatase MutT (NUDIX family)